MVETFLFGGSKGFGESVLIKINDKSYMIVDSFINHKTGNPRILDFLEEKDIPLKFVKFIVLTHCHHDHFRGISTLVQQCKDASFFTSKSIGIGSFKMLLTAYSKKVASKHNYFKEIIDTIEVLKSTNRKLKLLSDTSKPILSTNEITIKSYSPNSKTNDYLSPIYKKETKRFLNGVGISLNSHGFNYQSIVISIESDECNILLGADQEFHKKNTEIGWDGISENSYFQKLKFDLFKVPHHGSQNGYNKNLWDLFLNSNSSLLITPYSRSGLPRESMIKKIKSHGEAYITSPTNSKSYKKLPGKIGKKTKHLDIERLATRNSGFIHFYINSNGKVEKKLVPDAIKL